MHAPGREAWSACAGKGRLESVCRKGDAWIPCAGNGGLKCVSRYIISAGKNVTQIEQCRRGCTSGGVYVPCIYTLQDVPLVEFMYPCIYTLQDVPLVEFMYLVFTPYRMYLWWSLCTLYLLACQVWVTVVDSGSLLLCFVSLERLLTPLCVEN